MWFIAGIFERYTATVARTFIKLAAMEAEANRKALDEIRARRQARTIIVPAPSLNVPPPLVAEPSFLLPDEAIHAARHGEAGRRDADARVAAVLAALPSGVRGDVVARWVETFATADPAEVRELLVRLGKDKKVRVPELQVIVADVLEEAPTFRKKDEHLALLGRHFGVAPLRPAPKPAPKHVRGGPQPHHA
jgi:hypothetical protein